MAENAQATKHYKNRGLRQLSRTPWFENRQEAILEKAVTKFGLGAETEYTTFLVVSSFFFFPKTENTDLGPKKGSHWKRPFFLPGGKLIKRPCPSKPKFERKMRF